MEGQKKNGNRGSRAAAFPLPLSSYHARRPARTGVNPRNPTQKVKIPARNVVRFTAGSSLKEAANGKFKPLAAAKTAEKKAVATAKKDVKKATTAAKRTTAKAKTTAKKATKKVAPKKRK